MTKRLYQCLRAVILDGSLGADTRLPPSRDLARELGIARNTVVAVYGQLQAEGYTHSQQGSGTFVLQTTPEALLFSGVRAGRLRSAAPRHGLSARGLEILADPRASAQQWGAFMPGVPDVTQLPLHKFARLYSNLWRDPAPELLSYAYGGGLPELREVLAQHLAIARSIDCAPEQILITEGAHQAIDLVTRLLGQAGDAAWVENPGYWGTRTVLTANGIRAVPVPVDEGGMQIAAVPKEELPPRFIFVTPSHQYPLGSVMPLSRRVQLLASARAWGSWVIEDDYDSEFRFSGRPIAALKGLEPDAPVIYVGTFSKTLYPGLRVGYLVLPTALVEPFQAAHAELYREGHLMTQAVLASFIGQGHYASHIRRMRVLYGRRRAMLAHLIERRLGPEWVHATGSEAGLHLVMNFPEPISDVKVTAEALSRGILVKPLSGYYAADTAPRAGLMLGYACVPEEQMTACFERLRASIRAVRAPRGKR